MLVDYLRVYEISDKPPVSTLPHTQAVRKSWSALLSADHLTVTLPTATRNQIKLVSLNGQTILQRDLSAGGTVTYATGGITPGVYLVSVRNGTGTQSQWFALGMN
jgi:hypothetical protein